MNNNLLEKIYKSFCSKENWYEIINTRWLGRTDINIENMEKEEYIDKTEEFKNLIKTTILLIADTGKDIDEYTLDFICDISTLLLINGETIKVIEFTMLEDEYSTEYNIKITLENNDILLFETITGTVMSEDGGRQAELGLNDGVFYKLVKIENESDDSTEKFHKYNKYFAYYFFKLNDLYINYSHEKFIRFVEKEFKNGDMDINEYNFELEDSDKHTKSSHEENETLYHNIINK